MANKYWQIVFTKQVRQLQAEQHSCAVYANMDKGEDYNFQLTEIESHFIKQRDSFYMASVSETHFPYIQHRGGPIGFLRIIDATTLGFADFKGNRQYVSLGNFRGNDNVALFLMDYPNRRRLKLMGHIEQVADDNLDLLAKLKIEDYRSPVERGFVIHVEAFDWNCPQHITPRYTEAEIEQVIAPIIEENKRLRQKLQEAGLSLEEKDVL